MTFDSQQPIHLCVDVVHTYISEKASVEGHIHTYGYTNVLVMHIIPLKAIGGKLEFYEEVTFNHNRVDGSLGGALYLISYSQMFLEAGTHLNFINNTGRYTTCNDNQLTRQ